MILVPTAARTPGVVTNVRRRILAVIMWTKEITAVGVGGLNPPLPPVVALGSSVLSPLHFP